MNKIIIYLAMVFPIMLCAGQFKPYEIHADVSYYSNEYRRTKGMAELGEEKNLEEVYQNYNYYEAVFDDQERIVIFKAYERGVIEFSETYFYDEVRQLVRKVVKDAENVILSEDIIRLQPAAAP